MGLVKASAAALDRIRPPGAGLTVLIYHRVGARSGLEVDLPVSLFEEQMALLAAERRAVGLDEALDLLGGPGPAAGAPPVHVTFDDGTADFAELALPVLVAHRIPVTLYLATAFVDDGRAFPAGGAPLSWAATADAVSTGLVTVGSHTHTHALLDRLPAPLVDQELDRSIQLIGERLGTVPAHFAYPKAVAGSTTAAAAVAARFRSAALAGTHANAYGGTDPHRLARTPIQLSDGMRWFRRKLDGGMSLEDDVRERLNRRRYAGATA